MTIVTNVTKICHSKKVRYKIDCYILHTVLLAVILILIITIIFYHYAKHKSKQKNVNALTIMNLENFVSKNIRVIISMT